MTSDWKTRDKSTSDIILDVLIKTGEPLNLYNLSKTAKLSHQRVKYSLIKLIKKGLIVPLNTSEGTRYAVQRIHIDDELAKTILNSVEPLVSQVNKHLNLEHAENIEEALANNLALFVLRKTNETNR